MRHRYRTQSQLKARRGAHRFLAWDYRPSSAQLGAELRALRPKTAKLATELALREHVQPSSSRSTVPSRSQLS
jgi:hypothetical protein